jgi:16S rRNA (cytosine1407-C5)-methyltransferase
MRWQDHQSFEHWSLRKVRETQRKQKSLLRSAYAALKPGGVMVYCTCSFAPEENELVVNALLKKSDAMLLPIANAPENSLSGLTQWMTKDLDSQLSRSLRITPKGPWDGFYLARIAKPQ